jgi:hypothetical protein
MHETSGPRAKNRDVISLLETAFVQRPDAAGQRFHQRGLIETDFVRQFDQSSSRHIPCWDEEFFGQPAWRDIAGLV